MTLNKYNHLSKGVGLPYNIKYCIFIYLMIPLKFSKACLLVFSSKKSGVWLNATPVTSLGLRLDNAAVRLLLVCA